MKFSMTIVADAIPCEIVRQAVVEQTVLPPWFTAAVSLVTVVPDGVHIKTPTAVLLVDLDEMIILADDGEFYAADTVEFLQKFKSVEE